MIQTYTRERIEDVLEFERKLRKEESFRGWEIDDEYIRRVRRSFEDPVFAGSISLLDYQGDHVAGRIDCALIPSHFDGSVKAYLDWICVLKSARHRGVARELMQALREELGRRGIDTLIGLTAENEEAQRFYRNVKDSKMKDIGIWIDIPRTSEGK